MPLPIAALAGSLFGGGSAGGAAAQTAGPVDQRTSVGPISFGSKVIGTGASASTTSSAQQGGTTTHAASAPATPINPQTLAILGGIVAVTIGIVVLGRK